VFTVEPPFNSQNDRVCTPVGTKKRHTDPSRYARAAGRLWCPLPCQQWIWLNWYFLIDPRVKVDGQYYCDVLQSQQMLPAIKRVAERCLFTKQYVAYGEICHFLCSVISQGKVVALDRWGGKWNHLSMTPRPTTDYAKNYCNRTLIVKVIAENVVTCFLVHSVVTIANYDSLLWDSTYSRLF